MAAGTSKTLWIGDKWQIGMQYLKPDKTPFIFNTNARPAGELFLGKATTPQIELTIANGKCIVLDQTQAPGAVLFQLLPDEYDAVAAQAANGYDRLQVLLRDVAGLPTTQAVIALDIRNPRTGDIKTGVSYTAGVVTVVGNIGGAGQGAVVRKYVSGVGLATLTHQFDYQPKAWCVDNDGAAVDTAITYGAQTVYFEFSQAFTGTLYAA